MIAECVSCSYNLSGAHCWLQSIIHSKRRIDTMRYLSALLLLSAWTHPGLCLECWSCDNESSGGACEYDAESTGISTVCSEEYDYCYTRRVEEEGSNSEC